MSTNTSPAAVNGPYVIGYTLCFGLMGALVVQAYIYFSRFADDQKAIKILVTIVLLLETLITLFTFSGFWTSTTQGIPSGTKETVFSIGPSVPISSLVILAPISGLVTTLTHAFYCWRILTIRKSRLIPVPIMMVSLLQLASITYLGFTVDPVPSTYAFSYSGNVFPWLATWLAASVVCDLAITICMILSLRPSKSHFAGSKSTLVKLARLTIETSLVTAVTAFLQLILGVVFNTQMYHVAVFYAVSKLYSNCLLASLNFRLVLRSQSDPNLTAIVWDNMTSSRHPSHRPSQAIQILVQAESDTDMAIGLNEIGPKKSGSYRGSGPDT